MFRLHYYEELLQPSAAFTLPPGPPAILMCVLAIVFCSCCPESPKDN